MVGKIHVINIKDEEIPNDGYYYYIGRNRPVNILGNPYTSIKGKDTLATYLTKSREESIELYKTYLSDKMNGDTKLKYKINEIYELYELGCTIYLGCFCKPLTCHGDVIKEYIENKFTLKNILNSF